VLDAVFYYVSSEVNDGRRNVRVKKLDAYAYKQVMHLGGLAGDVCRQVCFADSFSVAKQTCFKMKLKNALKHGT